jgi:hypothetical protein
MIAPDAHPNHVGGAAGSNGVIIAPAPIPDCDQADFVHAAFEGTAGIFVINNSLSHTRDSLCQ